MIGQTAEKDDVRLRLLILAILTVSPGCLWTPRPYSADPLIRHRRATVGDFDNPGCPCPLVEPEPPSN